MFWVQVAAAEKPCGPGWQPQGHLSKGVQNLPWVHSSYLSHCTTSRLLLVPPPSVAMCDRAPGGFPWLLISILAPKSYFLGGDKSPDKFRGVDLNKKLNFEYEKLKIVNFCSNNPFPLSFFSPSEKFHGCCTHPLLYPRLRQLTHFVCFAKKKQNQW